MARCDFQIGCYVKLTLLKSVERLEYNGQVVVTLKQIDEVHGNQPGHAYMNYHQNRHQFEASDAYLINYKEAKLAGIKAGGKGVVVFTERGYLKLVKTFGDDLAWKTQGQLIDCYLHRALQCHVNTVSPSPHGCTIPSNVPALRIIDSQYRRDHPPLTPPCSEPWRVTADQGKVSRRDLPRSRRQPSSGPTPWPSYPGPPDSDCP